MKEFFLILFFAKSIVVTPEPIDIVDSVSLKFAEPVSAITSGAHIRIDVTDSVRDSVGLANIVAVLDYLKKKYPDGSVSASLTTATGEATILDKTGGSANAESAQLILLSSTGVPTGIDFSEVEIVSTADLKGVSVTWQNHYK
jgi:hypothetical protein